MVIWWMEHQQANYIYAYWFILCIRLKWWSIKLLFPWMNHWLSSVFVEGFQTAVMQDCGTENRTGPLLCSDLSENSTCSHENTRNKSFETQVRLRLIQQEDLFSIYKCESTGATVWVWMMVASSDGLMTHHETFQHIAKLYWYCVTQYWHLLDLKNPYRQTSCQTQLTLIWWPSM